MASSSPTHANPQPHPALSELSREELQALSEAVDRELETRAFEDGLKRQVDYHLRKSQRATATRGSKPPNRRY